VGAVSTTELTHATPASDLLTYLQPQAQYDIAAQLVPVVLALISALGTGVDVLMEATQSIHTYDATLNPAVVPMGRNLLTELLL